ncbi:hypothetical protein L1286_23840 [Pseudoalteromonas sp. SMS1]|uniref:hypothetical protein n=1 Tax=Pseudoalteromonas sp. SMS1 TaxID=2908894 RepID=UPI001F3D1422|nr:hypothetical protein [Pseudoalteromonas sp. SMS1]MCF2860499.1 hypothetical protein [Pseudoalteromonas sp. SMS1]
MECYDRVGERAKLHNSIKANANICYISGRSGVGKSHIVGSVLDREFCSKEVLKYEFGRLPLSLNQFLLVCALDQQSLASKLFQSIKNIKLNEISINIPMIGKAPLKWNENKLTIEKKSLPLRDILKEIEGPIYTTTKREVLRISNLLSRTHFKVIWISNIENINNNDLGLIFLISKYISPSILLVLEGAYSEKFSKQFESKLSLLCKENELTFSSHKVKPFNEHFARGLYNFLGLADKGMVFNFKNNLGYPVAIEFDLNENRKNKDLGFNLDSCFNENEQTKNTLLLLGLLFATENRYPNIIILAEAMDIELSLSKPLETGVVKLTDNLCELAHPQIARYITLTKRQDIYRLLHTYYLKEKVNNFIEIDLAAMAYLEMFDIDLKTRLLNQGVSYILEQLSDNNITVSDQILSFIEEGLESLSVEQLSNPVTSKICSSISLLRLQLDGMLCRLTGVSSNSQMESPMALLVFAQVRMRLIDLRGSIALTEVARLKIRDFTVSEELADWLNFCAVYIKLSCLLALGDFSEYKTEYQKLKSMISTSSGKRVVLFSLLPTLGQEKSLEKENLEINDIYLTSRFNNNKACQSMISNVHNPEIDTVLRKSIETLVKEGSIEVTFPINNYAIYAAYNERLDEAIDALFSMIDHSTYPYDYFTAYNNLAVAMGIKGYLEQALYFCQKAHDYILNNTLNDPVFAIKSYFNIAVLSHYNGDSNAWSDFKKKKFNFKQLPTRYKDLLNKKISYIDDNITNPNSLTLIKNSNIELANSLWPQNLQFWDFMYPIVSSENIKEIIDSGVYNG